jgi:hypothetical protein
MKISIIGDADIFWPEGFQTPNGTHLPYWDYFRITESRSPCMDRYFISTCVPPFYVPPDGLLQNIVTHEIHVEFKPGDLMITEMCEGGGRTWVDLFLDWDLVLSSSGTIFGAQTAKLLSPKPFETYLNEKLSPHGNTGAWELYRQYAEAVYRDTTFDQIPECKAERLATWQKYRCDYHKRYPGRRAA